MSPIVSALLLGDWHVSDRPFYQPQPQMFTSFCHNVPLFKHMVQTDFKYCFLLRRFGFVLDQYTWYIHHACHAGKHDHDGWLWITVRPVPKRGRKEENVLFNDALNTFYLRLYGVRHMVTDHSDSEKGNPLPPHWLLFPISSKGSFIWTIPDRIAHTKACYTSRGALAGMRNSSMGPPHEGSIRQPIAPWANALTTELYLAAA